MAQPKEVIFIRGHFETAGTGLLGEDFKFGQAWVGVKKGSYVIPAEFTELAIPRELLTAIRVKLLGMKSCRIILMGLKV